MADRPLKYPHLLDDEHKTLHLSDRAGEVIVACVERVRAISAKYGENSDEYRTASWSLLWALASFTRKGFALEAVIAKDGDLSLIVNEGDAFVYGVIFHGRRSAPDDIAGEWSLHS